MKKSAETLNSTFLGVAIRILRWKPYYPYLTHTLALVNKNWRFVRCDFCLTFDKILFQNIFWSVDKTLCSPVRSKQAECLRFQDLKEIYVLDCKKSNYGKNALLETRERTRGFEIMCSVQYFELVWKKAIWGPSKSGNTTYVLFPAERRNFLSPEALFWLFVVKFWEVGDFRAFRKLAKSYKTIRKVYHLKKIHFFARHTPY